MSKAVLKYVRVSPTKARLVAREVQGMNAELALASLEFMPNKAAKIISKVIASAVANGEYEAEDVVISSCRVDKASVLKRWRPRARGMATKILKPTSHIYVEVVEASASEGKKVEKTPSKKESKKADSKKAEEGKKPKEEGADSNNDLNLPPSSLMSSTSPETESREERKEETTLPAASLMGSTKESKSQKDSSQEDDLTKIKGIGKVYKERLNSEGIFTFEQVANMNEEQIDMMETKYSFKGDFKESVAHAKEIINGKEA